MILFFVALINRIGRNCLELNICILIGTCEQSLYIILKSYVAFFTIYNKVTSSLLHLSLYGFRWRCSHLFTLRAFGILHLCVESQMFYEPTCAILAYVNKPAQFFKFFIPCARKRKLHTRIFYVRKCTSLPHVKTHVL